VNGRVWKFGDSIDTDALAPGAWMKGPVEELARHCLESVAPSFASSVSPGDIVVAGRNFGSGSSREQAAQVLRMLGVAAVVASSFAGIFYRNAFNLGLPALISRNTGQCSSGDRLRIDYRAGLIANLSRATTLRCEPVPAHLMEIVEAGGLVPWLESRSKRPA
jgi:3-isopropylmalate/(R)-2-methylmalate dehydratase small subunit